MKRTLSFAFLLLLAVTAQASVIEYTSRSAWLAAAGSVTNIDFEGIAPSGGLVHVDNGLTLSGVSFFSPACCGGDSPALIVVSGEIPYVGAWGSGDKLQGGIEIDITLPRGVEAVGSDIMSTFTAFDPDASSTYEVVLSTGDVFENVFASGPPTRSFVGFTSTAPITSLRLISSGTFAMLDNVAFDVVPEPTPLSLFICGLIALCCLFLLTRAATG